MGGHRRGWVDQGGPVLDLHPVSRVGIVRLPALRHVVEDPGVEPATATGAALKEDLGVTLGQPVEQVVEAEDVAVADLTLVLRRGGHGEDLGQVPVEVPLDVVDVDLVQNLAHLVEDVVDDLWPAEVEDELVPGEGHPPTRFVDRPVGVLLVEFGVHGDHLRLEPEAELHPGGVGLACHPFEVDLLTIDEPVPQRGVVVVPVAKPAVVEDEHLNPQRLGLLDDLVELLVVEVKEGGLPVVDDDRPVGVLVFAAGHPVGQQVVKGLGHPVEPLGGEDGDRLGGLEVFPGL